MLRKIVYAISKLFGGSRGNTGTKRRTKHSDTRNRTRRAKVRTSSKQVQRLPKATKNNRPSKSTHKRKNTIN